MIILLIDENGNKVGQIEYREAAEIAKKQNKDLIQVSKDKSVYKIGDLGKLKYEQKRKDRKRRAQQKLQKIKEIQIRPNIDDGDLDIKLRRVREFLNSGLKTKLVMKFKKKQMPYREVGLKKINSIVNAIVEEELATANKAPEFDGRNIIVFLVPPK